MNMTRLRKIALGAISLCMGPSIALAQDWNLATSYPDADFHTKNIRQFVEDVSTATDQLNITVHSNGSLIKQDQVKRAVQTGQVQGGEVILSLLGNENAVFSVDSLPFLATNYEEAAELWDASRSVVEDVLAEDGLKLLFTAPWPPQGLYVSRPIDSVSDLRGLKLRVYNSTIGQFAEMTGMESAQVQVPELPQAFSTGIVDASFSSTTTGVSTKAWEYASYFYNFQAWVPKNMVIVNQAQFDALPNSVQAAVLEAAEAAETRGWDMSQQEAMENLETLKQNGLEVVEPNESLMSELSEVAEALTEEWLERAGGTGEQIISTYRAE